MVRIKVEMGFDIFHNTPVLRIDYYKSDEAYYYPDEYPNECFNCATAFDLNYPFNQLDMIKRLLNTIEISVNQLLNYKDIPPLDKCGEMKMPVEKVV